jgi:tRNA 2-thiocytidine biosynthesis protein TtcA
MTSSMHPKALESRLMKAMGQANRDFDLIEPNDRILVALSGGKDSYGMLHLLQKMRAQAPYPFELVLYHLDQGQPGHDTSPIEAHMQATGLPYEVAYQDTYTRVVQLTQPGKIYCSLCSRFRRAILYKAAIKHNCNKVALGHHRDDLIETLLLNILFAGQIKGMPVKLTSERKTHQVIRPLAYVPEEELVALSQQQAFPIVPCRLCGSQLKQRAYVKNLLNQLQEHSPHIKGNILHALSNVLPSHLLDKRLLTDMAVDAKTFDDALTLGSVPVGPAAEPDDEAPQAPADPAAPLVRLGAAGRQADLHGAPASG